MREYKVVQSGDLEKFEQTVSHYLEDGWKLTGGIAVQHCGEYDVRTGAVGGLTYFRPGNVFYSQAITRTKRNIT